MAGDVPWGWLHGEAGDLVPAVFAAHTSPLGCRTAPSMTPVVRTGHRRAARYVGPPVDPGACRRLPCGAGGAAARGKRRPRARNQGEISLASTPRTMRSQRSP
ncbi:hypothetical protein, partial [Burkholderia pseudomallei]|uniref:hypothetical protein n=1 Tax=Burkholderia pseudomallei TaxID=28450 RepID=UPI001CA5499B